MRDDNELRLTALEMVVGELVRRLSPAGFRESTMNSMDRCVGKLAELNEDEREDFAAFRQHVHDILYGKFAAPPGSACANSPAWTLPVMQAVGRRPGRR
jgi:hypothetical protein